MASTLTKIVRLNLNRRRAKAYAAKMPMTTVRIIAAPDSMTELSSDLPISVEMPLPAPPIPATAR